MSNAPNTRAETDGTAATVCNLKALRCNTDAKMLNIVKYKASVSRHRGEVSCSYGI